MSDNSGYGGYAPVHNGGCGTPIVASILLGCGVFLVAFAAGGGGGSGTTSTVNRTNVEVLSRPQLNLLSTVNNCTGDGSCPTYVVTTTTTTVAGDRSTVNVQAGGGLPVCWDARLQTYTSSACGGQP
jgi:hypothetical protein